MTAQRLAALTIAGAFASPLALAQNGVTVNFLPPLTPDERKTVMITDPAVLNGAGVDLTFGRTIKQIASTMLQVRTSDLNLVAASSVQSMLDSFALTSITNNGVSMPVTPRPSEASQSATAMLDSTNQTEGMRLVAVANRFDLSPANFSTCGEARLVYSRGAVMTSINRFFIIMEAAVPNPNPVLGAQGCLPITQHWASLANKNGLELARGIEQLFFTGLPGGVPAVVNGNNYGPRGGQIRVNMFMNSHPDANFLWQLREFVTEPIRLPASRTVIGVRLAPNPVADTALPTLYGDPQPGENQAISALRIDFQNHFISQRVPGLLAQDIAAFASGNTPPLTNITFLNRLGAPLPSRFSGFESTSQGSGAEGFSGTEDPALVASPTLKMRIEAQIVATPLPWAVTTGQLLSREGAGTCGGCHQFANAQPLAPTTVPGGTVDLPLSTGFVHAQEDGFLSPALEQVNLQFRAMVLRDFNASGGNVLQMRQAQRAQIIAAGKTTAIIAADTAKARVEMRDRQRARGGAFRSLTGH